MYKECENVSEFLDTLLTWQREQAGNDQYFRGQSCLLPPKPKLYRKKNQHILNQYVDSLMLDHKQFSDSRPALNFN